VSGVFIRAAALAGGMDPAARWWQGAETISRQVAADLAGRCGLSAAQWAALPCIVGSSSQAIGASEEDAAAPLQPPLEFAKTLARWFGVSGPVVSTSSACTSGLSALQLALERIDAGEWRHALVLGAEFRNRLTLAGFTGLGLVPQMNLRDALGALVVSGEGPWRIASLAWALDDAVLAGAAPDHATILRAMRTALSAAGWNAGDVRLVKLQATGIAAGDAAEMQALRALFPSLPRCVSLKSRIGHTLGASGPAELALLLDTVHDADRRVLFNLSGFGGHVAAMALERAA
jgi:3-oxoacyl-[acyl-carrier-protein] synthase-1